VCFYWDAFVGKQMNPFDSRQKVAVDSPTACYHRQMTKEMPPRSPKQPPHHCLHHGVLHLSQNLQQTLKQGKLFSYFGVKTDKKCSDRERGDTLQDKKKAEVWM
jgi:hypothetical protein